MFRDDNKSGIWPDSIDELSKSRRPPDDDDEAAAAVEAVDDGNDIFFCFSVFLTDFSLLAFSLDPTSKSLFITWNI